MIIYLTTNTINGKKYIGKDRNNLKSYLGGGTDLNKDIKKYGFRKGTYFGTNIDRVKRLAAINKLNVEVFSLYTPK